MTTEQAQLVESQIPFARSLAWRMYRRFARRLEREDLEGVAYLALASCISGFDSDRGLLKTYVFRRVNGAMLDFARAEDPLTRGQRRAIGGLQVKQQFAEEDAESGVKMSHPPASTESPDSAAIANQAFEALCRYETDTRSRQVMVLAFADHKTHAEIATHIGVAPSRVSQLVQQETYKLRAHMGVM